jgi:two-component system, chemotaxis family, chemotaxis protein CheY
MMINMDTKVVNLEGVEDGMLAADDVRDFHGTIIVHKNMEIEGKHMTLLKRSMVHQLRVVIPEKVAAKEKTHINDWETHVEMLSAARIMVVDDSKYMRFKLEKIMTEAGLKVVGQATNGKEAIDLAETLKPDVVTMDVEMPGFDGLSAIEPLKKVLPNVLIIMISSVGEDEKVLEALAKGAADFIVKPIDPVNTIKSIINTIVALRCY